MFPTFLANSKFGTDEKRIIRHNCVKPCKKTIKGKNKTFEGLQRAGLLATKGNSCFVVLTDLKMKIGLSILFFLDSDIEANCFGLCLASQQGCQRKYIDCILC